MRGTSSAEAAIIADAIERAPLEACGLLLASAGGAGGVRAVAARNVAADPARRFVIDPQTLIDAHRAARGGGAAVLGYYHSHPAGPPAPSATDLAEAAGDGMVWAIAGRADGRWTVGWWESAAEGFNPLSTTAAVR